MKDTAKLVAAYSASSLIASLPVAWFFRALFVPGSLFGRYLWIVMPVVALLICWVVASLVVRFTAFPGMGFWRGSLTALLALVGCSAIASPALVPAALIFVGWFVFIVGGIVGWLLGRSINLNYSFNTTVIGRRDFLPPHATL